ncbi:hypothetical protein H3O04_02030 [Burkholderia sp. KCJ3K979]|uniref:hypothetical protein n=1 Tax=Burkholderia sp. KCJ3K979 TaxID=2759149 RepID=UPI001929E34A|nr:hypothetical protein [Burkholderia sp. KCJ3K979]MBL3961272.1 hypothetical protein [Burkholderia sp. KCJ3K979]
MRRTTGKQKTKTKPPHGDGRRRRGAQRGLVHRVASSGRRFGRYAAHAHRLQRARDRRDDAGNPGFAEMVDAAGADRIDLGELARMPTVVTLFDRLIKTAPRQRADARPPHLACASSILPFAFCSLHVVDNLQIIDFNVKRRKQQWPRRGRRPLNPLRTERNERHD